MYLACGCGKAWRWPDGAQVEDLACPACSRPLQVVDAPVPSAGQPFAADVRVLLNQKRALRNEMRVRDMTIRRLRLQVATLKKALEQPRDSAPTFRDAPAFNGPLSLPDDRVF